MLVSPLQWDGSPGCEGIFVNSAYCSQHLLTVCHPPSMQGQKHWKMTSWIKTWIRFILNLLGEVMSGLLIWQAIQSFQKRFALLKESHFSKELGRPVSYLLRVCTRACVENQATSREGIHPEITSKGWLSLPSWDRKLLQFGHVSSLKEIHFQVWSSEVSEQITRGFTVIPGLLPNEIKVIW